MKKVVYTVANAISALDEAFPLHTQDSWDNSGLLVGDASAPLNGVLLSVDLTESAVDYAASKGFNLIIAHHPLMFRGLRRLTLQTAEQRTIVSAIANNIALAAFHTPADKSLEGTSGSLARLLGLQNIKVLVPEKNNLCKIQTYVPPSYAEAVKKAMASAGTGHIGNYSHCAWSSTGTGEYLAEQGANPFVGKLGDLHHETEVIISAICAKKDVSRAVQAITAAHPYEEPAIDILPLENVNPSLGYGAIGSLPGPHSPDAFLRLVKEKLNCKNIRHTTPRNIISSVAICTGSGSEFVSNAVSAGADAYITADMKYHQMTDAADSILVADVGHYESENLTKDIFKAIITRKLANFAPCEVYQDTNPIKYY